ncbi:MAG TPA: hypothetical protein PLV79_01780 [Bacteroidales bacterium]|jgi:hypothetical protein|nr:hypothetical protein [Bacteroidales bacterium]HOV55077.1 hypothetical protein [Bacteroidales bacterium]
MEVSAKITGITYTPYLCKNLKTFNIKDLEVALSSESTFILKITEQTKISVSWWVSAKRTRSYPYARVYDSLSFQGKRITIIPIMKDEGKDGDRDFLQWDTISLMSLLGIYTIISYYDTADKSLRYKNKITNQKFNILNIKKEIKNLLSYQSDALHWNIAQIEKIGKIGQKALNSYEKISEKLKVEMHSNESAKNRIDKLNKGKENFMIISRDLAKKAQYREYKTIQPKEKLSGTKATLTITNYLGGCYFFTCDEVYIKRNSIYLVEGKHSKNNILPSIEDIKDGLVKMILFTNLTEVKFNNIEYKPIPILKLTTDKIFSTDSLNKTQMDNLRLLKKEALKNHFQIIINNKDITTISF